MESEAADQVFHDLEQRYLSLHHEHEVLVLDSKRSKDQIEILKRINDELRLQLEGEEKLRVTHQLELKQNESRLRELSEEGSSSKERYTRLMIEFERLREDFQNQSVEMSGLHTRLKDLQILYSEAKSDELPLKYEMSKISREKELLEKQAAQLETEMARIQQAEREKAMQASDRINHLELQISAISSDFQMKTKENDMLKDQAQQLEGKYLASAQRLHSLESELILQQSSSSKEIEALKRLEDLHKRAFIEANTRVEELEGVLATLQTSHSKQFDDLKAAFQSNLQEQQRKAESDKQDLLATKSSLEGKVAELESILERSQADSLGVGMSSSGLGEFKVTDMYDRIVKLERELLEERRNRKEAETYMNQILKDVESKAPALTKQRRDHQRLVEYQSQLTARLDQFVEENTSLKSMLRESDDRLKVELQYREGLERQNQDLSRQIQNLLRQSLLPHASVNLIEDDHSDAQQVISNSLVTFNNVEELQQRNVELLTVIRKLTSEMDQSPAGASSKGDELKDLMDELLELREARQRTEEMVSVLIQQRDCFKSMVDNGTSMGLMSPNKPPTELVTAFRASRGTEEIELRLQQLQDENKRLNDQLLRVKDADDLLHESMEKLRSDLTSAKLQLVQAKADARFHRDRNEKLEESLKLSQQEATSLLMRRTEMDKTLQEACKDVREREEQIMQLQDSLRGMREGKHRLEIEGEVLKASEARLAQQVSDLREEMKKNISLGDHLHRLEHGLHQRAEEDKQQLVQDKEALEQAYKELKRQYEDRTMIDQQKLRSMEEELRNVKSKHERREVELHATNDSLVREREILKASQGRNELLERQLQIAQERLANLRGAQVNDDILEKTLNERELEVQNLKTEIQSLRDQLAASEVHAEQYRKISSANETMLTALQQKAAESEKSFSEQVSSLQFALDKAKEDLYEQRGQTAQLVRELEELKEKERLSLSQYQEDFRCAKEEIDAARAEQSHAIAQLDVARADGQKFQESAKTAFDNYERELQQHARAERELREERAVSSDLRTRISQLENHLNEKSTAYVRLENAINGLKEAKERDLSSLKEQIDLLQKTNEALHGQVESYSLQMEKMFETKASSMSSEPTSTGSDNATTLDELSGMKRSSAEMREVLRYMKREKEMLQAKLSIVESENARYSSQVQALQKIVDELKTELKRESETRTSMRSEEEFAKLLTEIGNTNLVRESNAHLRSENEDLLRKLKEANAHLNEERATRQPFEEAIRKLSADKEALEMVNDQLNNDVTYWKNRLHNLVSRYNDVDPEEHRLLRAKLEETSAALEEAKVAIEKADQAATEKLGIKDKEIAANRASLESAEKNANQLREKLRGFKTKIEELTKAASTKDAQFSAANQQLQDAQTEIVTLRDQLSNLGTKFEAANAVNASLTSQVAQMKDSLRESSSLARIAPGLSSSAPPPPTSTPPPILTVPSAVPASFAAPALAPATAPAPTPTAVAPAAAAAPATASTGPAAVLPAVAIAPTSLSTSAPAPTPAPNSARKRERQVEVPQGNPSPAKEIESDSQEHAMAVEPSQLAITVTPSVPPQTATLSKMKQALLRKQSAMKAGVGVSGTGAPKPTGIEGAIVSVDASDLPAAKKAKVESDVEGEVLTSASASESISDIPLKSPPSEVVQIIQRADEPTENREKVAMEVDYAKPEVSSDATALTNSAPTVSSSLNPFASAFASSTGASLFSKPLLAQPAESAPSSIFGSGSIAFPRPFSSIPIAPAFPPAQPAVSIFSIKPTADATSEPACQLATVDAASAPSVGSVNNPFASMGQTKPLFGGFVGGASMFGTAPSTSAGLLFGSSLFGSTPPTASPYTTPWGGAGLAAPLPPIPDQGVVEENALTPSRAAEEDPATSVPSAVETVTANTLSALQSSASVAPASQVDQAKRLEMRAARFAAQQAAAAAGGPGVGGRGKKRPAKKINPAAMEQKNSTEAESAAASAHQNDTEEGQVE